MQFADSESEIPKNKENNGHDYYNLAGESHFNYRK